MIDEHVVDPSVWSNVTVYQVLRHTVNWLNAYKGQDLFGVFINPNFVF